MAVSDHGLASGDVADLVSAPADDLSEFPFLDLPGDMRAGFEASAAILGVTPGELGDAILLWMVTEHRRHPDELPEGLGEAIQSAGPGDGIDLDAWHPTSTPRHRLDA